jgi:hypothetical protein
MVLALALGVAAVPAAADTLPAPVAVDVLEATLLTRLNAERAAAGLGALATQPWAQSVARAHSQDMAAARDIWHNHTGYLDIAKQSINAYLTGENVAEAGTLDEADGLLMNSPPHRANILYPAFNYVGIGVAIDSGGYVYVTQDFVTIRPASAVAMPTAPKAPAPTQPAPAPKPPAPAPKPPAPAPTHPAPAPSQPAPAWRPPAPYVPVQVPARPGTAAAPRPVVALPTASTTPVAPPPPLSASPLAATRQRPSSAAALWAVVVASLVGTSGAWLIGRRRGARSAA